MQHYTTTDLNVAAFLTARGHQLLRIEGPTHGRQFAFASGAEEAPTFFLNALVGARDFASALRQLKAAIHAL